MKRVIFGRHTRQFPQVRQDLLQLFPQTRGDNVLIQSSFQGLVQHPKLLGKQFRQRRGQVMTGQAIKDLGREFGLFGQACSGNQKLNALDGDTSLAGQKRYVFRVQFTHRNVFSHRVNGRHVLLVFRKGLADRQVHCLDRLGVEMNI